MYKLLYKFESLIYFSHGLNHHIQDDVLYNGRMLEGIAVSLFIALIWKFLTKYVTNKFNFSFKNISTDNKC